MEKPIKIIDYNEHALTFAITIFSRNKTVKYIPAEFSPEFSREDKIFDFYNQLTKSDPVSVWLLLSFENEECKSHQFVRPNDELYRTPDRMGEKSIPEIIFWDEICTVSLDVLQRFLEWLLPANTKVTMCGDHGQPPPFVGLSPHDWLKNCIDYYEESNTDQRALDEQLRDLDN